MLGLKSNIVVDFVQPSLGKTDDLILSSCFLDLSMKYESCPTGLKRIC